MRNQFSILTSLVRCLFESSRQPGWSMDSKPVLRGYGAIEAGSAPRRSRTARHVAVSVAAVAVMALASIVAAIFWTGGAVTTSSLLEVGIATPHTAFTGTLNVPLASLECLVAAGSFCASETPICILHIRPTMWLTDLMQPAARPLPHAPRALFLHGGSPRAPSMSST